MRKVVAAAAVALVLAGACGGDGDGGGANEAKRFTVVGTEMAFEAPERVTAGEYAVTFRNAGAVYHELAFRTASGTFLARRSIGAGQSVEMTVELEPGTYELGCFEPGHYEAGMYRTLVVT